MIKINSVKCIMATVTGWLNVAQTCTGEQKMYEIISCEEHCYVSAI